MVLVQFEESMRLSCSRSAGVLTHEWVPALLDRGDLLLGRDHNGVLVYELTGGVGEG